jgi:hypothetical protein
LTSAYSVNISEVARRVLHGQARERQQKDEFCGPFWAAVTVTALTGRVVTQDDAAIAAGTLLTEGGGHPDDLPPGAASRTDHPRGVRTTRDTGLAGTSPRGIVRSIGELSEQGLVAVPICGPWDETAVNGLTDLVIDTVEAVAILNVATRYLWHSHTGFLDVLDYLSGEEVAPEPSEWQVGHYVAIVGSLVGSHRRLVACADTYPTLGVRGVHVQPPDAIAAALTRADAATTGGAIVVTSARNAPQVMAWVASSKLGVGFWDNGVPDAPPVTDATPAPGLPDELS